MPRTPKVTQAEIATVLSMSDEHASNLHSMAERIRSAGCEQMPRASEVAEILTLGNALTDLAAAIMFRMAMDQAG